MADSISEKIVDDTLFKNGFEHERNKRYYTDVNARKFDCDFYITKNDLWIEYFGLYGQSDEYDEIVEVKRKIAKDSCIKWMYLIPDDLYPNNKVLEKVGNFLKKHE